MDHRKGEGEGKSRYPRAERERWKRKQRLDFFSMNSGCLV